MTHSAPSPTMMCPHALLTRPNIAPNAVSHRQSNIAHTPRATVLSFSPADTQDETSSSSETTPTSMTRKSKPPFAARKSSKPGTSGKRHVRSSSGYSSHNEETTFR